MLVIRFTCLVALSGALRHLRRRGEIRGAWRAHRDCGQINQADKRIIRPGQAEHESDSALGEQQGASRR